MECADRRKDPAATGAVMEAGKLLENLSVLWEEADLAERRNLLMAMRQRFFNY